MKKGFKWCKIGKAKKQLGIALCASLCFTAFALASPANKVAAATQTTWNYDYTGGYQTFTAPSAGTYKLEVWGAQGGKSYSAGGLGGNGGYSSGECFFNTGDVISVYVGSTGQPGLGNNTYFAPVGYNGGVQNGQTIADNTSFPSPSGTSETGHSGNGYARITLEKASDTTPPKASYTLSKTTITNSPVTITLSASDDDSGVASIKLPDNSVVTSNTATYTVSANGTYNFIVTDKAGNSATVPVTVSNIDTTAPAGTYTLSTTETTKDPVTISFTATDNAGVASITLPDGSVVKSSAASCTAYTNGTYKFIVTDVAGNTITVPVDVTNINPDLSGISVADIITGKTCSFAITTDGEVYAWGNNNFGQLGIGNTKSTITPVKVEGLSNVAQIVMNDNYSVYAITVYGDVYSWGNNNYGQLGIGNMTKTTTPTKIDGLSNVDEIKANSDSVFAYTDDSIYAWGNNAYGKLGLSGGRIITTPTLVSNIS